MKELNIVKYTDSYKYQNVEHLQRNTDYAHAYFEPRDGMKFKQTVFFGLQYYLKRYLEGIVVTEDDIKKAESFTSFHLGGPEKFNKAMWKYILSKHGGKLPISIKAVPEGTVVNGSNVFFTVENTDPNCPGLVSHLETLLTLPWYPSTVATKDREIHKLLESYLDKTADSFDALPFMLHCFGMRGATTPEAAGIGSAGHLVNFMGTDTTISWGVVHDYYNGDQSSIGFSVYALEHNDFLIKGRDKEYEIVQDTLISNPNGIVSVVADTYDIYNFVNEIVCKQFKEEIENRDGTFVVRPDTTTDIHRTPAALVSWIFERLWKTFGGFWNSQGYRVLNSCIRVLYGDGLSYNDIKDILENAQSNSISAENFVFGCGAGLLQKDINRDTQRFAYKVSAIKTKNGDWFDTFKDPRGGNKKSKAGRLKLVEAQGSHGKTLTTVKIDDPREDQLVEVFRDGDIINEWSFDEIRERAAQKTTEEIYG